MLMNFMHFHHSSTPNCDHHILLTMTGDAHKGFCHKLLLIFVREYELYTIKTDRGGKMAVAFTIKEKSNGKPILRCGAAPFLFVFVLLSS